MHFVRPLEAHFQSKGFAFKKMVFKLFGNIKHISSGEDASDETVNDMIHEFFDHDVHQQFPVDGAVAAINDLSKFANVLFLTNIPHVYREARQQRLLEHGLHFPVVTNSGAKGPALAHIAERVEG
ncbi:MAG: hypothetical protein JKY99_01155, partial [Rhizobiales bacterium]|nr:hypothetical protein [Hyphomicrobiales bacterium]